MANMLVNTDMNITGRKSLRTCHRQNHSIRPDVRSKSL